MMYKALDKSDKKAVAQLFTPVFSSSEGDKEGRLIGKLSFELAAHIDNVDRLGFGVYKPDSLIGALFFTRLQFNEPYEVFMLAPVAVSTQHQRKGIGQALIHYGLGELKKRSVEVAVTYGDPSFYSQLRFQPLPEHSIQAPLTLSMPFGWLGQSLTGEKIPTLHDRPRCVKEFDDPVYW